MYPRSKLFTFFNVFFLCCFSLYAISPVAGMVQNCNGEQGGRNEIRTPGLNLYVVHLFLTQFMSRDDQENEDSQDENSGAQCLLKKKRAVLSSKDLTADMVPGVVTTIAHDPDPFASAYVVARTTHQHKLKYDHDVLSLHSGISPPFA